MACTMASLGGDSFADLRDVARRAAAQHPNPLVSYALSEGSTVGITRSHPCQESDNPPPRAVARSTQTFQKNLATAMPGALLILQSDSAGSHCSGQARTAAHTARAIRRRGRTHAVPHTTVELDLPATTAHRGSRLAARCVVRLPLRGCGRVLRVLSVINAVSRPLGGVVVVRLPTGGGNRCVDGYVYVRL